MPGCSASSRLGDKISKSLAPDGAPTASCRRHQGKGKAGPGFPFFSRQPRQALSAGQEPGRGRQTASAAGRDSLRPAAWRRAGRDRQETVSPAARRQSAERSGGFTSAAGGDEGRTPEPPGNRQPKAASVPQGERGAKRGDWLAEASGERRQEPQRAGTSQPEGGRNRLAVRAGCFLLEIGVPPPSFRADAQAARLATQRALATRLTRGASAPRQDAEGQEKTGAGPCGVGLGNFASASRPGRPRGACVVGAGRGRQGLLGPRPSRGP